MSTAAAAAAAATANASTTTTTTMHVTLDADLAAVSFDVQTSIDTVLAVLARHTELLEAHFVPAAAYDAREWAAIGAALANMPCLRTLVLQPPTCASTNWSAVLPALEGAHALEELVLQHARIDGVAVRRLNDLVRAAPRIEYVHLDTVSFDVAGTLSGQVEGTRLLRDGARLRAIYLEIDSVRQPNSTACAPIVDGLLGHPFAHTLRLGSVATQRLTVSAWMALRHNTALGTLVLQGRLRDEAVTHSLLMSLQHAPRLHTFVGNVTTLPAAAVTSLCEAAARLSVISIDSLQPCEHVRAEVRRACTRMDATNTYCRIIGPSHDDDRFAVLHNEFGMDLWPLYMRGVLQLSRTTNATGLHMLLSDPRGRRAVVAEFDDDVAADNCRCYDLAVPLAKCDWARSVEVVLPADVAAQVDVLAGLDSSPSIERLVLAGLVLSVDTLNALQHCLLSMPRLRALTLDGPRHLSATMGAGAAMSLASTLSSVSTLRAFTLRISADTAADDSDTFALTPVDVDGLHVCMPARCDVRVHSVASHCTDYGFDEATSRKLSDEWHRMYADAERVAPPLTSPMRMELCSPGGLARFAAAGWTLALPDTPLFDGTSPAEGATLSVGSTVSFVSTLVASEGDAASTDTFDALSSLSSLRCARTLFPVRGADAAGEAFDRRIGVKRVRM